MMIFTSFLVGIFLCLFLFEGPSSVQSFGMCSGPTRSSSTSSLSSSISLRSVSVDVTENNSNAANSPTASSTSMDESTATVTATTTTAQEQQKEQERIIREEQKRKLLALLGGSTTSSTKPKREYQDPVLADPITKEGILMTCNDGTNFKLTSSTSTETYTGSTETWLNLLEPIIEDEDTNDGTNSVSSSLSPASTLLKAALKQATPFIPPAVRGSVSSLLSSTIGGDVFDDYVPMRDLFTNPQVSFAYERGWRQQFQSSGFPGPDKEAQLAMDYFLKPAANAAPSNVIIDMSCATGLFTRRFAASGNYDRVIGCDYSSSMLTEARRRINANDDQIQTKMETNARTTTVDLVQLDVGQIPMQTNSVDCFHAGAAMHCWPDLDAAATEIYRVLKPNGGRYFATTFLSTFFKNVARLDQTNGRVDPSQQAFQYFDSIEVLRDILIGGGFVDEKLSIEVLGAACVVIRAEK